MTDQTSDSKSQGQDGLDSSALQERLSQLSADLAAVRKESRQNQRRADRAEALLLRNQAQQAPQAQAQQAPVKPQVEGPGDRPLGGVLKGRGSAEAVEPAPATATSEELESAIREAMLLREVVARGLSMEDVEDIEFEDARDLRRELDLRQQRKEIEELRKKIEPGTAQVRVDAGGPSGLEQKRLEKMNKLAETAQALKKGGRHTEATWVTLRRLHADASKVIPVGPSETEGE